MSATTTLKAEREARKAKRAADKAAKLQALADAEQAAKSAMTPPPQPRQLGRGADALLGSHPYQPHAADTAQAQERGQALPPYPAYAGAAQLGPRALQPGGCRTDGRCSMSYRDTFNELKKDVSTLGNWVLALLLAACILSMTAINPMEDHRAEWAQSTAAQDAIKTEAARARFERAAGQMCGNAGFKEVDATTIQCQPRKASIGPGATVQVAEVAP